MIWRIIHKKDPETAELVTKHTALRKALISMDFTLWHNTDHPLEIKLKRFSILKAAVYEENYDAFTVEGRGKLWYIILK